MSCGRKIRSVSYTHLDVYKRQVQKNENGTTVPQADGKPKKEDKPKRELTPQQVQQRRKNVSYTHLSCGRSSYKPAAMAEFPVNRGIGKPV